MNDARTCEAIRQWMEDASESELRGGPHDESLVCHLEECPACRQRVAGARTLAGAIADWQVPEPRVNIQARVMASIARQEQQRRVRKGAVAWLRGVLDQRIQVPAYAVAAVLVLFVASVAWNFLAPRGNAGTSSSIAITNTAPSTPASMIAVQQALDTPQAKDMIRQASVQAPLPGGGVVPVMVMILGVPPGTPFGALQSDQESKQSHIDNTL